MFNPPKTKMINLDEKTQKQIYYYMPSEKLLRQLSDFFSTFSDITRIKILSALAVSDLCVNDISNLLKLNQTTVSHQLKILRNNGAVTSKRDGKVIYYSIGNEVINQCLLDAVNYLVEN